MAVRTAVIPAAGLGTRFLPITKALPKEMLPLVDRPVIQYAVEQAVEAGIERIIIVTSPGRAVATDYFQVAPELEETLEAKGSPYLEEVRRVSRMADVTAVHQHEPLGLGHAVLTAKQAVGDQPFIVYLPDEILIGPRSATQQLLEVFDRRGSVIGVTEVPRDEVQRYGVVAGERVSDREWRLSHVVEKPPIDEAPSNMAIVGPYVFTPAIFHCLETITPGAIGEIQLTDGIALLAKREPVHSLQLKGKRHDAGTPVGLLKASVELALDRPEYAEEIKAWLRALGK
jgi:UTP--glucose-1-phosphate uridylyltransferase